VLSDSDKSSRKAEIEAARSQRFETRRATVPALEEILFSEIPILDHGFIRVVDYMGDDAAIVQAARVSYGRGTRKLSEDRGLIRYLMRHQHTTPFEMPVIKLHVKLPIFVARQWIRHRMASVNEYSARYSILDREFYIPEPSQVAAQSKSNRQGRSEAIEAGEAARVLEILREDSQHNYDNYLWLLNENEAGERIDENRLGIARELARMNLTLNAYTQWYWKIDLHNLMHFLRLRADSHAQYEIRVYADAILSVVERWVPLTYDAFNEYRREAVTLSRTAIEIVRLLIAGKDAAQVIASLPPREWSEIRGVLHLEDGRI
jgi:thymidylate synthase (FAD)